MMWLKVWVCQCLSSYTDGFNLHISDVYLLIFLIVLTFHKTCNLMYHNISAWCFSCAVLFSPLRASATLFSCHVFTSYSSIILHDLLILTEMWHLLCLDLIPPRSSHMFSTPLPEWLSCILTPLHSLKWSSLTCVTSAFCQGQQITNHSFLG